jgi:hypothetical protein
MTNKLIYVIIMNKRLLEIAILIILDMMRLIMIYLYKYV